MARDQHRALRVAREGVHPPAHHLPPQPPCGLLGAAARTHATPPHARSPPSPTVCRDPPCQEKMRAHSGPLPSVNDDDRDSALSSSRQPSARSRAVIS